MTSSSPKKPRITALTPSRSERFPARPLLVGGLCAALLAGAVLLVAGRGGEESLAAAVRQPPAASPAPPAPVEQDLVEQDLVVFPEMPAVPAELPLDLQADGILLVSGGSGGHNDAPEAEILLAFGMPAEIDADPDRGIILVSAGATEPDAVIEPAIGLADVPKIALADEPAAASPPRDRPPTGSRLRPRDSGIERRDAARRGPCGESLKACKDALQFLRDDDIASIDLDIRVGGTPGNDYPCECRLEGETFQPRRFASTTMTWKAAGYCHKPLYFEDWELERYGHSRGMFLDPFIAGAHFFVTLPILPYKAGMQAPWECVYPLGYYRPGSCAPWTVPGVPYSPRGFAVQAATVTGLVFLLP